MKKFLLVAILIIVILNIVACGGSGAESFVKGMLKISDNYAIALEKVTSKEDLIKAINIYSSSMVEHLKTGKVFKKDELSKILTKSETVKKSAAANKKIAIAEQAENVRKYMTNPEVIKAMQDYKKSMASFL